MTQLIHEIRLPELTDEDFDSVRRQVYDLCGLNLHEGKKQLVKARLSKRMRKLGMNGFDEYFDLLRSDEGSGEISHMVDALTTNKTEFFREAAHFDFLAETAAAGFPENDLRIWSAGCSSGEEVYTLGMCLHGCYEGDMSSVRILGSDISQPMVDRARKGLYPEHSLRNLPENVREEYFRISEEEPGMMKIAEKVKVLTRFARLNLMDEWPIKGGFDAVFCRNVMIYFDKPTQQHLINRFYDILNPGGYLFVGHSESLARLTHDFKYLIPAVYRKK